MNRDIADTAAPNTVRDTEGSLATLPPSRPTESLSSSRIPGPPLIDLWLAGKAPATRRTYTVNAAALLRHAGRPLRALTLAISSSSWQASPGAHPATQARAAQAPATGWLLG